MAQPVIGNTLAAVTSKGASTSYAYGSLSVTAGQVVFYAAATDNIDINGTNVTFAKTAGTATIDPFTVISSGSAQSAAATASVMVVGYARVTATGTLTVTATFPSVVAKVFYAAAFSNVHSRGIKLIVTQVGGSTLPQWQNTAGLHTALAFIASENNASPNLGNPFYGGTPPTPNPVGNTTGGNAQTNIGSGLFLVNNPTVGTNGPYSGVDSSAVLIAISDQSLFYDYPVTGTVSATSNSAGTPKGPRDPVAYNYVTDPAMKNVSFSSVLVDPPFSLKTGKTANYAVTSPVSGESGTVNIPLSGAFSGTRAASVYVRQDEPGSYSMGVQFKKDTGQYTSVTNMNYETTAHPLWGRFYATVSVPSDAIEIVFVVSAGASGATVSLTGASLSDTYETFFYGDTPNDAQYTYTWSGAEGNSESNKLVTTASQPVDHAVTGTVNSTSSVQGSAEITVPAVNHDVSGTVTSTANVFADPFRAQPITGQIAAVSTVSGSPAARITTTGTIASTTTVIGGTSSSQRISGLAPSVSTVSGTPIARAVGSGTVAAVSGASATPMVNAGVSGTSSSTTTAQGTLQAGAFPVAGAVGAVSTVDSGTITRYATISGSISATTTASGTPASRTAAAGTAASLSTVTGNSNAAGPATGAVVLSVAASGSPTAALTADSTVTSVSAVSGTPTALLVTTGSTGGTATVTGSVTPIIPAVGTASAVSATSGSVLAVLAPTGAANATTSTSGNVGLRRPATGAVAGTSSVTGTVGARFVETGTVAASTSVVGAATLGRSASGTVTSVSGTNGTPGAVSGVNGSVTVFSTFIGTTGPGVQQIIIGTVSGISTTSGSPLMVGTAAGTASSSTVLSATPTMQGISSGQVSSTSNLSGSGMLQATAAGQIDLFAGVEGSPFMAGFIDGNIDAVSTIAGILLTESGTKFHVPVGSGWIIGELHRYHSGDWRPEIAFRYDGVNWVPEPGLDQ